MPAAVYTRAPLRDVRSQCNPFLSHPPKPRTRLHALRRRHFVRSMIRSGQPRAPALSSSAGRRPAIDRCAQANARLATARPSAPWPAGHLFSSARRLASANHPNDPADRVCKRNEIMSCVQDRSIAFTSLHHRSVVHMHADGGSMRFQRVGQWRSTNKPWTTTTLTLETRIRRYTYTHQKLTQRSASFQHSSAVRQYTALQLYQ